MMKAIHQAVTADCLFRVLESWLRDGAGKSDRTLRILSAFGSAGAVQVLEPLVDVFLSAGNRIEAIIGVDLGGTDRHALERLNSLKDAYQRQIDVWIWEPTGGGSIFHPKLYVYEDARRLSAVVGSANLTLGGLSSNLESLIIFEALDRTSIEAKEIHSIWATYANPRNPLPRACLQPISAQLVERLAAELPERSREDAEALGIARSKLWMPLSKIPLPKSGTIRTREPLPKFRGYLLMDILDETRSTQVQPPREVIERFFGVQQDEEADLAVSIITSHGLSQPITRTIVRSNYMRRIEIPQIRDLERPCGIVVYGRGGSRRRFAYRVIPRRSDIYAAFDQLLRLHGEQARERRYLIGRVSDEHWETVSSFLPSLQ